MTQYKLIANDIDGHFAGPSEGWFSDARSVASYIEGGLLDEHRSRSPGEWDVSIYEVPEEGLDIDEDPDSGYRGGPLPDRVLYLQYDFTPEEVEARKEKALKRLGRTMGSEEKYKKALEEIQETLGDLLDDLREPRGGIVSDMRKIVQRALEEDYSTPRPWEWVEVRPYGGPRRVEILAKEGGCRIATMEPNADSPQVNRADADLICRALAEYDRNREVKG